MEFREATVADAGQLAQLHAGNWRRTYRGMFSDQYLDGDLVADRLATWTRRLPAPAGRLIWLAVDGSELAGFVYCIGDQHQRWGTLVENLHVAPGRQSAGLGRQLLAKAAQWAAEHHPSSGIHLEVVVGNDRARAFYEAIGGRCAETFGEKFDPWASGHSDRMVWDTPADLAAGVRPAAG